MISPTIFKRESLKYKKFDRRRDLFAAGDCLIALGYTKDSYPQRSFVSEKVLRLEAKLENWPEDKLRISLWHLEKVLKYTKKESNV